MRNCSARTPSRSTRAAPRDGGEPRQRGAQATRSACRSLEGGGPPDFVVSGQDSRLGQVITNLIENARSFSPPGGIVRVTLAPHRPFRDAGGGRRPGHPPDALERIFDRFYTDRPDQGFGQNSGLGLSISRQIIEAHGGRIWAENRQRRRGPKQARGALRRAPSGGVESCFRIPRIRSHFPEATAVSTPPTIHASAVSSVRAHLIRGPSGAGKSRLALALITAANPACAVRPPGRR